MSDSSQAKQVSKPPAAAPPPATTTTAPGGGLGILGLVLVRIVVPAWILAGALLKFASRDPSLLPKEFRSIIHGIGMDLKISLAILLGIECVAVAIMLFVPRLARLMAVIMLSAFTLVLVNELIAGNIANCGCLGSFSPPPWLMLTIDVALLLLVVAIRPTPLTNHMAARLGWMQASVVCLVASIVAFAWVLEKPVVVGSTLPATSVATAEPDTYGESETESTNTTGIAAESDAVPGPGVSAPKSSQAPAKDWYELDTTSWVGQNVRNIDLVQYVRGLPDNIEDGDQYLIFYSRTCDHCQMLLEMEFGFGVPVPTTLVAVPETTEGFNAEGLLDNPCLDCKLAELPTGVSWIMTPPVVLALSNGEVVCVKENEDFMEPECLPFH